MPYYPKRLSSDMAMQSRYDEQLAELHHVTPIGRLGTYRYLDMDQVIGEALDLAADTIDAIRDKKPIPQRVRPRSK